MQRLLILFSVLLVCSGCGEKKSEPSAMTAERAVEALSGKEPDARNSDNIERNNVDIDVLLDGENIGARFKDGFGSIVANRDEIVITVNATGERPDNLLIGFSATDLTTMRPIHGKTNAGDGKVFTLSLMKIIGDGMEAMMSFDAEGTIVSMSNTKTVIKVTGHLGYPADAENPEKWKKFHGTITLHYPVFQTVGIAKDDVIY
ncbi:hypothetical protein [Terrimonas ferruginea]|uniref:hypothetical protein n=1 Tax=Terrimonas ferruginea TaxID=249 RepID=UPI0003F6981A|nr:hypothetical protein [Terrimonas ferruginea]